MPKQQAFHKNLKNHDRNYDSFCCSCDITWISWLDEKRICSVLQIAVAVGVIPLIIAR